ncbi:hypothetical protein [Amycolatopsis sp.]|uniref:hypothetical protein n=1 Tax=Amycolatopsis sp. TaxID=37632 RepID=UPI002DF8161E|nr:hypothetical protein [Amycolatopsis sp.]
MLNFAADTAGWCLPKGGGGATVAGRWFTEHALERMAPRTAEVMDELEARFNRRVAAQGDKLNDPVKYKKFYEENYPAPRGVPPSVVAAEIANPGSTSRAKVTLNDLGDVVTVILVWVISTTATRRR